MSDASDYLKAEVSKVRLGPTNRQAIADRIEACRSCQHRLEQIDGKTDPGGQGFCGACNCGSNRRAALSVKVTMPHAKCPKGRWMDASGTGPSLPAAADVIAGVAMSVSDQVRILLGMRDKSVPPQ